MFLTKKAQALLEARQFDELQKLKFDDLIENANEIFNSADEQDPTVTAPISAQDHVLLETLVDPVVISSGHVYSRNTVERLLRLPNPVCPNTRKPILRDCIVPLPQITTAIGQWKLMNLSPASSVAESLQLTMTVSGNKVRMSFDGNTACLGVYLEYVFRDKQNDAGKIPGGYYVDGWGFARSQDGKMARMELWFPVKSLSNDDVSSLICKVIEPLSLPFCVDDAGTKVDIKSLGARQYVTVLDKYSVTPEVAGRCMGALFVAGRALHHVKAPHSPFNETVSSAAAPVASREAMGFGIFTSSSSSAAAAAAADATASTHVADSSASARAHLTSRRF